MKTKGEKIMKKKCLLGLLALSLGGTLLAGCNVSDGGTITKDGAFALEAVSSIRSVASLQKGIAYRALKSKQMLTENGTDDIKEILPSLDLFLENGFEVSSNKEEGSFLVKETTFAYKETLSFQDLNQTNTTYTLFYNLVTEGSEVEEDEEEKTTIYKGLASLNEETYLTFDSVLEVEKETGEEETEVSFTIYENENSYYKVEESHEIKEGKMETEFGYKYVQNGAIKNEYSIEIEKKGTKNKIEFEIGSLEYELEKKADETSGETIYFIKKENEETDQEVFAKYRKVILENGSVDYQVVTE